MIAGGRKSKEGLNNGIRYHEVRQYQTDFFLIRFYFVTRCYNAYVESIMKDLQMEPRPDLLIMNSCLWDITRFVIFVFFVCPEMMSFIHSHKRIPISGLATGLSPCYKLCFVSLLLKRRICSVEHHRITRFIILFEDYVFFCNYYFNLSREENSYSDFIRLVTYFLIFSSVLLPSSLLITSSHS